MRAGGPNAVLAAFVGAVVVLAVVAGLVVANRSAPALDPDSPEGVVQQYLLALVDEDYPAAVDLVATSAGCDVADIEEMRSYPGSLHVVLDGVRIDGDRAVVTLDVTEGAEDDPFGASGHARTERVVLEREDDAWRIASADWLLFLCGEWMEEGA